MTIRGGRSIATRLTLALAALVAAGCDSHSHATHPDADAAAMSDGRDAGAEERDVRVDAPAPDVTCSSDAGTKKVTGQTCSCSADCASGHCVDGVCCSSACNEACKTCSAMASVGTCTFLVAGTAPRDAKACVAAAASTCGFDGLCDGAGACRRHVAGTICKAGTCDGDAVTGGFACDGAGRCKPGPTTICAPYSCDPAKGACFESCNQSSECVSGQQCVNASCGKKMKGATCAANTDCASGFCADKVCCNVACQGGCVACALPGRQGTCWPIDQGAPDPRGSCQDQGAPSCGTTGICDGFGGCEKYAAETQCIAPSCTGTRLNTPGTCDGSGTCRAQGVHNCSPFLCTAGACTMGCLVDGDCESGHACVNFQCGKKTLGQTCAGDGECLSGQCVEGVCCDGACMGACRSCALPSSMGRCTSLAVGAVDIKSVCSDQGATTCGTNGKCDGSGGCQKYKEGTQCAPESCASNVYTPPSTCSATGQCTPPDSLPCSPYVCNGNACFNACATDQNCVTPNVCNDNSCGKKMRGASCSDSTECQSTFCAQGVCCDTACAGACTSCALGTTRGTCTNAPAGSPDQSTKCADAGGASCGQNGKCDGSGACQKYPLGTACKDSKCPAQTTMFTPGSTCDGAGSCVTPPASSCFPFQCGAAVCKAACTADADCALPAVCIGGSCGLKGLGKTCGDGMECLSGFCAQGVCCNTACSGICASCALPNTLGMCRDVPDGGKDPQSRCVDQGLASCGTDGVCDGQGACRLYAAGTACMAASCGAGSSTLTLVRTCDGQGTCKPATTQPCAPYLCNGVSACKAACTVDADCLLPNICDPQTNLCGNKRRLGQTCAATADCLTGNFCVDGVCCGSSSCGLCETCATGTCANVGAGKVEAHGGCAASPLCGNTGNCNGAGACEQAGVGVSCGMDSCAGSTYTPVSHCTGVGGCAAPTTSSCSPYVCGTNTCRTVCATDTDCVAPFTCQGSGSTRSCALKANGLVCVSGGQCISGNCVDTVCCGSASCPACQACNVTGAGACAPVAAGTPAPGTFCADQGATSCGTNAKCDGMGGCQKYADGTACAVATCPAGTATLMLAGSCGAAACSVPTQTCAPYFCNAAAAACHTTCNVDGDCASTHYCTGVGGACAPKGGAGGACTAANQCATGNCVDNVCCGSASCPSCQACNVAGSAGACAPLSAGSTDANGSCTDQGAATCGTNGKCNGAGGCQKYGDGTACATATCPAGAATLKLVGSCSGGACSIPTQTCAPYFCNGAAACHTTCNVDGDCAAGFFCTGAGGSCVAKGGAGATCAAGNQCTTTHCVDGVCCGSAACGSCQACNVANNLGACAPVAAGTLDPKGLCVDQGTATCGTNARCDGLGGCQKYLDGTMCAAATCPAGAAALKLPGSCSGGSCSVPTQSCAPYFCNAAAAACHTTCNVDGDCASGFFCSGAGGSCVAKSAAGASCTAGNQCTSTHCVDNVCCGSAACGSCQACNVANNLGTCAPVAAGTLDPKGVCADAGAPACSTNGRCDGTGACQKYPDTTTCAPPSCPTGMSVLTLAGACSGGTCATTTQSCAPYACNGTTACRATCAGDGDCAAGNFCAVLPIGTCTAKLALGATCGGNNQCTSGHCTDGVCCGSAACPSCQACDVAGTGACAPVAAGTPAPAAFCSVQDAATCGRNGKCNGLGGCQNYDDGTVCSLATCPAGAPALTLAGACSGGSCAAGTQSCNGYTCNGGAACRTSCDVDGDCASGYYCTGTNGSCFLKLAQGDGCAFNNQCANGHCVDNVCCGTATCASCKACNVTSSLGTCANVGPGGLDPRGQCQDQTAATCGTDGLCDGAGACDKYADGTGCATVSCPAGSQTLTLATTCAAGSCPSATHDCAPFKCNGTDACLTTCNGDGDCTTGNYCTAATNGVCVPRLTTGACTSANQCAAGLFCTNGFCCGSQVCPGCKACDGTGSCQPLAAGTFAGPFCLDEGQASCKQNGKCDGSGGCQKYGTTAVCQDAFCMPTTNVYSPPGLCDGSGGCVPSTTVTCDPYLCKTDGTACATCNVPADCATNNCQPDMTCGP
jgi:hypothetical protein